MNYIIILSSLMRNWDTEELHTFARVLTASQGLALRLKFSRLTPGPTS